MTEAISRRPFVRPLLYWMTGIVFFILLPIPKLFLLFLIPAVSLIVMGVAFSFSTSEGAFSFAYRWIWGLLLLLLFLFFSVAFSEHAERRMEDKREPSGLLIEKASEMQHRLVEKTRVLALDDRERSVLAALTVGYRSEMPREVNRQFAVAGIAHLLSVSGFHVTVLAGFVSFFLFFLPRTLFFRWLRFLLTVLAVWVFAFITGLSVPSVRAAVMLTVFLTGRVLRRSSDKYNTLAATAFCLLVYQPFNLLDVGFQLSFISVFFILYLQPKIAAWLPVRNPLLAIPWRAITVTLAAQVGTVFLCCFYFGQVSAVFLFTNFPVSLLAGILIPVSLVWMVLPAWVPGGMVLQHLIEGLLKSLFLVVDSFSHVPGANLLIRFDLFMLLASYLALFLFLYFLQTKRVLYLNLSLGSLLFLLIYMLLLRG